MPNKKQHLKDPILNRKFELLQVILQQLTEIYIGLSKFIEQQVTLIIPLLITILALT